MPKEHFSVIFKEKIREFKKVISVDSDKSLSIRSILLGSICEGVSEIKNLLESEDSISSINFVKKLGIKVKKIKKGYLIFGKGLGGFSNSKKLKIDLGNSGTLCRLGSALLATNRNIDLKIVGDKSLSKRDLKTLIKLLMDFGATFYPQNRSQLPLKLISSDMPVGIKYVEKKGSAQIKSAAILAGLNAFGKTTILVEKESRDHTENLLRNLGAKITKKKIKKNYLIEVEGKQPLRPFKININGDPSSAAFFTALTILGKRSTLKIVNLGLNPTRIGFYNLLKRHGAKIKMTNIKRKSHETYGDIIVKSGKIKPISCDSSYYSKTVDEYPILFVIAALSNGLSKFKGIQGLANKESNRILEMKKLLKKINIKTKIIKGGIKIHGLKKKFIPRKLIIVNPKLDHRICQSAAILALVSGANIKIKNFETVNTSAPSFLKIIKQLGGKFEIKK